MTVALDKSPEDARLWIEAARPTHPSPVDTRFLLADLYHIVNVPTVLWIDASGRIVRPNDVAFGTDRFRHFTGVESARYLAMLRDWVRGDSPGLTASQVRAWQRLPTAAEQQARAEFALAPHDFTIRRGSMPMRGLDPMGPEFRRMVCDWAAAGQRYYDPLPDTAGRDQR